MIINSIGDDELDKYELEDVENSGACEVWYAYHNEGYEGWGNMILRKGDKFGVHDLGHCSCYPPTEDIGRTKYKYSNMEEIRADCSKEYAIDLENLIAEVTKTDEEKANQEI